MLAHYGYEDGSGRFYITVDTQKCNGCGACVEVCPNAVLEMAEEDPLEEELKAAVSAKQRNQIKYACNPCKPAGYTSLPCVAACEPGAIAHAW